MLTLKKTRRFMEMRGFAIDPPLRERSLGRIVDIKEVDGARGELGFWWTYDVPRLIYQFPVDSLLPVTQGVLDSIGAARHVLVQEAIRPWHELFLERYRVIPWVETMCHVLGDSREGREFRGGIVFEECRALDIVLFCQAQPWSWLLSEMALPGPDLWIIPVGTSIAIRLMHEACIALYCRTPEDMVRLKAICETDSWQGRRIDDDMMGKSRVFCGESGPFLWIEKEGNVVLSRGEDFRGGGTAGTVQGVTQAGEVVTIQSACLRLG